MAVLDIATEAGDLITTEDGVLLTTEGSVAVNGTDAILSIGTEYGQRLMIQVSLGGGHPLG